MVLWKIIMLVAFSILMLGLIVLYLLFRAFLNYNAEKTIAEVSSHIKGYLYWLLAIGILTIILMIVGFILRYTL